MLLHAGMGDVLMAVPLLRALDNSAVAGLEYDVIVKSPLEQEVLGLFELRRMRRVTDLRSVRKLGVWALARWVFALNRDKYDAVLAVHGRSNLETAVFSLLASRGARIGPAGLVSRLLCTHTVCRPDGDHKTDFYLRFARVSGLIDEGRPAGTIGYEVRWAEPTEPSWLNKNTYIILSPGSGKVEAHKRWPAESYIELGRRLLARGAGLHVVICGSESERELVSAIAEAVEPAGLKCHPVIGLQTRSLFRLYRGAVCVVAGCSGATHVAAATDTPIIGLYGPTNPGYTGPNTQKLYVVRLGLSCSPCYRPNFRTGCGNPVCMSAIPVDVVARSIDAVLAGRPYPPRGWFPTTSATQPSADALLVAHRMLSEGF